MQIQPYQITHIVKHEVFAGEPNEIIGGQANFLYTSNNIGDDEFIVFRHEDYDHPFIVNSKKIGHYTEWKDLIAAAHPCTLVNLPIGGMI